MRKDTLMGGVGMWKGILLVAMVVKSSGVFGAAAPESVWQISRVSGDIAYGGGVIETRDGRVEIETSGKSRIYFFPNSKVTVEDTSLGTHTVFTGSAYFRIAKGDLGEDGVFRHKYRTSCWVKVTDFSGFDEVKAFVGPDSEVENRDVYASINGHIDIVEVDESGEIFSICSLKPGMSCSIDYLREKPTIRERYQVAHIDAAVGPDVLATVLESVVGNVAGDS